MSVLIICDNDTSADVDGVLQLAEMFGAANLNQCSVLCVTDPNVAASALVMSQIRDFYGYSAVPCGRALSPVENSTPYYTPLPSIYPNSFSGNGSNIPDAVLTMRKALATASPNSVILFSGGAFTNYSNLLQSSANYSGDGYGTGLSLVTSAVYTMVCLGGDYVGSPPSGTGEFNFSQDTTATAYVLTNFPRPIIFVGVTFGGSMSTGATLWTNRPSIDVAQYCLGQQVGSPNTRLSYDNLAFLYAIRGVTGGPSNYNYFVVNGPGVNSFNTSSTVNIFTFGGGGNTGIISYSNGTGNHYYLTKGTATNAQIVGDINSLITTAVSPSQLSPIFFAQINETSGASISDSTGTVVNGTIAGSTPPTFGDHYLDFSGSTSGSNGNVSWTDAQTTAYAFNSSQSFTAVCSLNQRSGGGTYQALFQRSRDGSPNGNLGIPPFWGIFVQPPGTVITLTDGTTANSPDLSAPSTGTWFTCCGGYDANNHLAFTGDVQAQSIGYNSISSNVNQAGSNGFMRIGNDGSPNEYSVSYEGNFRIYSFVLTYAQMSQCHVEPIRAYTSTDGTKVSVVLPLYLRQTFTTDNTGWYIVSGGSQVSVSSASVSGQTITLSMGSAIKMSQNVSIGYFNGATVDSGSQRLLNFGSFSVSNNSNITSSSSSSLSLLGVGV